MQRTYSEILGKRSDSIVSLIRKNLIKRKSSLTKSPDTTLSASYPIRLSHRARSYIEIPSLASRNMLTEYENWNEKNESVKKLDTQNVYFQRMAEVVKKEQKKIFLERKLIVFLRILYVIISALLSLVSVTIYAIFTSNKEMTNFKLNLFYVNFALAHLFFIETIILVSYYVSDYRSYFLKLHSWIDLILITGPYISMFLLNHLLMLDFIRILHIMKLFKLFNLIKSLKLLKLEINKKEENYVYKSRSIVKRKIFKISIYLLSVVIVLAGIVQQINTFNPTSFNVYYMTFMEAFYFMIITLTTVGYGDIIPTMYLTRLLMIGIISYFIFIVSYNISELASLLERMKNIQHNFEFTDHYIIFGDIPNNNVSQIHLVSFFEEIYAEYLRGRMDDIEKSPYCILITLDKDEKQKTFTKLEQFPFFNNRIFHLKVRNLDSEVFRLANIKQCKVIYCMNGNINSDYWISDKLVSFYVRNLENIIEEENFETIDDKIEKPKKPSTDFLIKSKRLFVQYMYNEEIFPDLLNKNIFTQSTIPRMKLKYSMFAKNIFVKGWVTFITNLFVKHNCIAGIKNTTKNYYLNHYLTGMNHSLINFKFPKNLHGMEFRELRELIYVSSIEYVNLIKKENKVFEHKYKENEKMNLSEILLIGVMCLDKLSSFIKEDEEMMFNSEKIDDNFSKEVDNIAEAEQLGIIIKKIKYNPSDHKIGPEDHGIFIASRFINFKDFFAFINDRINSDKEFIPNRISGRKESSRNLRNIYKNELEKKLYEYFTLKSQKDNSFVATKYNKFLFSERTERYKPFALLDMESLSDHILILGWNFYMDIFISKIRMHSIHNTIVILGNDVPKDEVLLKKFRNLYLVKGDYLDLNVLRNLNTQMASYVVIITSKSDVDPNKEDSNSVLAARMIEQYFNVPFIIEIREAENIKFLGYVPVFQEYYHHLKKDKVKVECLYPHFAQGNILFNRLFDKMNARAMTNNFEVACMKELIQLDFSNNFEKLCLQEKSLRRKSGREKELEHASINFETKIFTNSSIKLFSFPLDKSFENKLYKDLLLDLLKLDIIPLGIYNKRTVISEDCENSVKISILETASDTHGDTHINANIHMREKMKKFCRILQTDLNQSVLDFCNFEEIFSPLMITNPPNDMKLNSDMEVTVLGNYKKLIDFFPDVKTEHTSKQTRKLSLVGRIKKLSKVRRKVDKIKLIMKKLENKLRKIKIKNEFCENNTCF